MDLDGDGRIDVLSGCYTHRDGRRDMVGEFYLFRGEAEGYAPPERLRGTDGEPLVVRVRTDVEYPDSDRTCTRPTAVDLDGDGDLDIVTGNEAGLFALFQGESDGFAPESSFLTGTDGALLKVDGHSDPHFADWDGDGDLDLLSGSESGEVSWFPNVGTRTAPRFGDAQQLVAPPEDGPSGGDVVFGDGHITGPQTATRVTTADVDGDGKLDLLVGDAAEITNPAAGLTEEESRTRLAEWHATLRRIVQSQPRIEDHGSVTDEEKAAMEAFYARRDAHWEVRPRIIDRRSTGFVWLLRRK
ncbi:MAG: FG-GAP-like repeat-containing protein [Planctomycetota bacterium]